MFSEKWRLTKAGSAKNFKVTINGKVIDKVLFNYTPYMLIPISDTFTLYVGVKRVGDSYHTFLSDIKFVEGIGWTTNIDFRIIANKYDTEKFLKSMNKSRNAQTNCMGLSYFLRKFNILGYNVISKFQGSKK